ncbi:hypothetical protein WG66_010191, partial [Moniliophthora roreri]
MKKALKWVEAWNNHNIHQRGQCERSPHDMFFFSQIQNGYRDMVIYEPSMEDSAAIEDLNGYGVDWEELDD